MKSKDGLDDAMLAATRAIRSSSSSDQNLPSMLLLSIYTGSKGSSLTERCMRCTFTSSLDNVCSSSFLLQKGIQPFFIFEKERSRLCFHKKEARVTDFCEGNLLSLLFLDKSVSVTD